MTKTLLSILVIIVIVIITIITNIIIVLRHYLLKICWLFFQYFLSYLYSNYSICIIDLFIDYGIFYYQNCNNKSLKTFWSIKNKNLMNLENLSLLLPMLLLIILLIIYIYIMSFIFSIINDIFFYFNCKYKPFKMT